MNYTAAPDVNSMVAVTGAANNELSSGGKFHRLEGQISGGAHAGRFPTNRRPAGRTLIPKPKRIFPDRRSSFLIARKENHRSLGVLTVGSNAARPYLFPLKSRGATTGNFAIDR